MASNDTPSAALPAALSEAQLRQQLARELKDLKKNPIDRTAPGGRFRRADGTLVDADGKPLEASADAADEQDAGSEGGEGGESTSKPPRSASEYEAMDLADLEKLAKRRKLAVEGSGSRGKVLKTDLVAALVAADAQA